MDWRSGRRSDNVEDRRGRGGGLSMPGGRGGLGCAGVALIVLIGWALGGDPMQLLGVLMEGGGESTSTRSTAGGPVPEGDEQGEFLSMVLADTEDTWNALFASRGQSYREPTLVLFDGSVASACGFNSAAVGPFYCPPDQKLYLDTSFFEELRRFGAPGDFAQAYVVAHEVGHHVQNLLGIADQVARQRRSASREEGNALQVRMELQADCLAGVWAHHAAEERNRLEPGDVEEGLQAAAAIGDDRMQRRATGSVQPESWTHGSSEMRQSWLRRGLETGDIDACDTFGARQL